MRSAIYARVSSKRQRDEHTIEAQLRDLPAWCAAHGWTVVATYTDDGVSAKAGNLARRTGLLAMLEAAQAGRFDVLVCVDIDRLTRSTDLIEQTLITGTLQRAGVKIASPSAGVLDPDTFAGGLTIGVKAAASAEWLRQHRARIKAGKASAIARNRKPAGPTPYGWTYSRATGAWAVNAEQAAVVLEVLRRVAGGETCHDLAREFTRRGVPRPRGGGWCPERVWQIASSNRWVGRWLADRRKGLALALPPIATEAQCDAAKVALARHRRHTGPRARHVYLLERIATCGLCGSRLCIASAEPSGNIRATYVCSRRRRPRDGAAPCPLRRHPIALTDAEVWAAIVDALTSERMAAVLLGRAAGRVTGADAEANAARAEIARLDRARTVALSHHAAGTIDDLSLAGQLRRLREAETAARHRLTTIEHVEAGESPDDPRAVAGAIEALRAACDDADQARRRQLVRVLAASVTVDSTRIAIGLRVPPEWIGRANGGASGCSTERSAGRVVVLVGRERRRAA